MDVFGATSDGQGSACRGYSKLDSKLDLSRGVTWQLAGYVANSSSCSSSSTCSSSRRPQDGGIEAATKSISEMRRLWSVRGLTTFIVNNPISQK